MRDITERRSHNVPGTVTPHEQPQKTPPSPRKGGFSSTKVRHTLSKLLEHTIDRVNQAGGMIRIGFDSRSQQAIIRSAIITSESSAASTKKLHLPLHIHMASHGQKTINHVGRQVKRLHRKTTRIAQEGHRHLRTPLGKVAAIQGAMVLALFLYITSISGALAEQTANKVPVPTDGANPVVLRQFLPTNGDAITPKAFSEVAASTQVPLYAWITPWNAEQQKATVSSLAGVSAFWLSLAENGEVTAKGEWSTWDDFAAGLQPHQPTFLTISGDPNTVATMLADTTIRDQHIENLFTLAVSHNFSGIDIDYEGLTGYESDQFTSFVRALKLRFSQANKQVAVTVEARLGNQVPLDWATLGSIADQVHVMAYDYHSRSTNVPGPVSAVGWVKDVLDYATTRIPNEKLVVGLGNYGYDWIEPTEPGGSWEGIGISYEQAIQTANTANTPIIRSTGIDERGFDIGGTPTFTYTDAQSRRHEVWFEDSNSLQAKQQLAIQYQPKGIIFWSVGLGDHLVWNQNQ